MDERAIYVFLFRGYPSSLFFAMRFIIVFLLFCSVLHAQKNSPDTTKTTETILTSRPELFADTTAYRIKPGDRLRIRSLNALEIIYPQSSNIAVASAPMSSGQAGAAAYTITVDRHGQIVLPSIGRVKIAGLTKLEATAAIEQYYKNLINEPIFDIEITNLQIKVLGSVSRQGMLIVENEKLTLGEVIAMSGGIDFATADKTIKLIRTRSGKQQEINYNIRNLGDPSVANIPVFDGDYVFVPPSKWSLRMVKNQRITSILSPIVVGLNTVAVVLGLYLSLR